MKKFRMIFMIITMLTVFSIRDYGQTPKTPPQTYPPPTPPPIVTPFPPPPPPYPANPGQLNQVPIKNDTTTRSQKQFNPGLQKTPVDSARQIPDRRDTINRPR